MLPLRQNALVSDLNGNFTILFALISELAIWIFRRVGNCDLMVLLGIKSTLAEIDYN